MLAIRQRMLEIAFGTDYLHKSEYRKRPTRIELINYLLEVIATNTDRDVQSLTYLEIGVRDVSGSFNHVVSRVKYAIDPAVDFDFDRGYKLTSDLFFQNIAPSLNIKFDIVFVDGLHTAEQVDRDIANALAYLSPGGFVVLHDCNPPTEWHARESQNYLVTPAAGIWNGSTWKAFVKWRKCREVSSCCIDSDWGLGLLTRDYDLGEPLGAFSEFYDYDNLRVNRAQVLNLIVFEELKLRLGS
jgi:SAM-dependent methyltransferase